MRGCEDIHTSRYCRSTCTRQHAQCRDSTITLTKYLLAPEGAPPPPFPRGAPARYLLLRGRPPGARLLAPERAPARYLLLRGRGRPPGARQLAPEGAPARYLLLRGRPPGARLLAPEGAPRPPLFTPHRTLPLPRSPGEGKVLPTRSANQRAKEECGGRAKAYTPAYYHTNADQLEREGKVLPTRSANQRAREESFPCNCT